MPNTDSLTNIIIHQIDTIKLPLVYSDTIVVPKNQIEKIKDTVTIDSVSNIVQKKIEKDTLQKNISHKKTQDTTQNKKIDSLVVKLKIKHTQELENIVKIKLKTKNTLKDTLKNTLKDTVEVKIKLKIDTIKCMTPEELFGHNSKLLIPKYTTEQPPRISQDRPFVTNTEIAVILLFIICFYSFLLYRFIHPIRIVIKNIFSVKATMNYIETPSQDFVRFMSYGHQLSQLAITLTITTIASTLAGKIQSNELLMFLTTWLALQIITLTQTMISKWCAKVSTNIDTFSDLQKLRKFNVTAFTIIYAPMAILATFSYIMTITALLTMLLLAFWHIFRILSYLRFKKFSFLQWFLYLCTVELLPILAVAAILSSLIRTF